LEEACKQQVLEHEWVQELGQRRENSNGFCIGMHKSPAGVVVIGINLCRWFLVLIDSIHIVVGVVKAAIARILSYGVISIRKMGLKMRKCNICCPSCQLGRNFQVTSSVVSVGNPHELVFLCRICTQLCPLRVELKAITEDIVAKIDVLDPGCWIANMPIKCVLSHPMIQMITLRNTHHRKNWSFFPSRLAPKLV
jgi:hypothetical protein